MPIKRPDTYEHNNPNEPIVKSKDVKGGALFTADLDTLLTDFTGKENKLQQGVTKVYVISEGADYRLINIAAIGTLSSWKKIIDDLADELEKFTPKLLITNQTEGSGGENAAVIRNPNGASFLGAYSYGSGTKVTGIIRITLPVAYYNMMMTIEGSIKRGNSNEIIKFTIGGYFSGNTTNNWWGIDPSIWERQLTDNLDLPVKFGYKTIESIIYPVIDLGELTTVWSSYTFIQIDKIYAYNGTVDETFLDGYTVEVIDVDDIVSNLNNTLALKSGGGGASSFADLDGAARDNADLLSEIEALELADTNEAATRLAADNSLSDAIDQEITDRENGDAQTLADAQTYADLVATDVLRYAGNWDASTATYPTAGSGTGTAGAIRRGDTFEISVAGTIDGNDYEVGDQLRAKISVPGQTTANWTSGQTNTQQATTSKVGIARMATNAEAIARSSSLLNLTPSSANALILDEKKHYTKEVFVLSVLEMIFPMEAAGQLTAVNASAAMSGVQFKVGSGGTYAAFTTAVSYSANAEIYVSWNYVSQVETRGWIRLTGKDN